MHDSNAVRIMMNVVGRLKGTPRTGWNDMGRRVDGAESVASHSYGLAMLEFAVVRMLPRLDLNLERLLMICLVHDLVEALVGDMNVYAIKDADERARFKQKKQKLERQAIYDIRKEVGGPLGQELYELWKDYEFNRSPEALIAHDLDKLEVVIQAAVYFRKGHRVDPWEFYESASQAILNPDIKKYLEFIKSDLPTKEGVLERMCED